MNPEKILIDVIAHSEDESIADAWESASPEYIENLRIEAESNLWRWCCIEVRATYGPFSGSVYLGCCSYEDGEEFRSIESGYYADMKNDAIAELKKEISSYRDAIAQFDRVGPLPFDHETSTAYD